MFKHGRRLKKKLATSVAIIFIYILGQNILLPYVQADIGEIQPNQAFFQMLKAVYGSNRQSLSVFSLGIMPYMMASILLMLKNLGNSDKKHIPLIPIKKQIKILTLLICIIMSFLRTQHYAYTTYFFNNSILTRIFTMTVLITGAFTIVWLADMNTGKGLGGMVIIIIVNILKTIVGNILEVIEGFQTGIYGSKEDICRILVLVLIGVVSMITILFLEESELRIPIQKVMIYNEMSRDNYMAVKLDPIGIQPMMYVMAFYVIPYFVFNILAASFPDKKVFLVLAEKVQLNNLTGISVFLLIFFLLTVALAMVEISPSDIAEQMQKSGDCIIGLRPGRETQEYIRAVVLTLSICSAVILGILIGIPMVLRVLWNLPQELVMIPMSLMFMGGITRNVFLEARVVERIEDYQEVL